ncbi:MULTISPECIES: hypothetical protein [unclassified Bradyrhizobium]|uniref:hypothetical protein n=1 Tax=unclassified Bradyrhizobium TaxID=2631580 RepID=UPI00247ADE73|nr:MULTISPECIES: hypothetical protein [unclassified Bradyrhizobium]WGR73525.1 hypothetical protein MTX24_12205 [Bradyrhizobium sp. ISRA426]WGR78362.1 hypothetical protein MTX21_37175 [Bradyrhizobium sp. ISRA430]WGR88764.1 hypothetical protein MTX25_12220 [Bradyrhizobium sp. ISRA432]
MLSLRLLLILIAPLALAAPVFAQGTQQNQYPNRYQGAQQQHRSPNATGSPRYPVATRPSNNPFQNPIGQGVPPAVSANPNLNSNRTNTR